MRAVVLGGTRFIGRALVAGLLDAGHEVMLVHRGAADPDPFPDLQHVHVLRTELDQARPQVDAFAPDVLIDMIQFSRETARSALTGLPGDFRRVVISSMDVYDAYDALHKELVRGAMPADESGPLRTDLYPYRGSIQGMDDYEKLDVEEEYLGVGSTVCRLPMVYGEHDYQRREEPILRRVRAGRTRIPMGAGNWLATRGYVGDVARGIRLAAEHDDIAGEVFNLGEQRSLTAELWARAILEAAGSSAELVRVPDEALPEDLGTLAAIGQHMLVDSAKARAVLGWTEIDKMEAIGRSVRWHLAHPPETSGDDFGADDEALARAGA